MFSSCTDANLHMLHLHPHHHPPIHVMLLVYLAFFFFFFLFVSCSLFQGLQVLAIVNISALCPLSKALVSHLIQPSDIICLHCCVNVVCINPITILLPSYNVFDSSSQEKCLLLS